MSFQALLDVNYEFRGQQREFFFKLWLTWKRSIFRSMYELNSAQKATQLRLKILKSVWYIAKLKVKELTVADKSGTELNTDV